MNIIYKCILKSLIQNLFISSCIFLFISLLTRIIHYGDLLSNASIKLYDIFLVMALVQPKIIFSLLPFTLLISCFLTYNNIISSNEHIALYNTGKSNFYLISPFFFVAGLLFIVLLFLSNYVIPKAYIKIEMIQEKIALSISSHLVRPKEFTERGGILLFIYKANEHKILSNILIADRREDAKRLFLVANEGIIGFNGSEATLDSTETYIKKYTSYSTFPLLFNFKTHFISMNLGDRLSVTSSAFSYQDTLSLIHRLKNKDMKVIKELKARIGWPFFIFLIPLGIISCMLRFFNFNRNKISVFHIIISGFIMFYISFSALYGENIYNKSEIGFFIYYINIILIFLLLLFMCKEKR